jgi:mannose-1-phosphate guanylyltransferase/mannose-6-phosphate isomerase
VRLWPASTAEHPKQFIALVGERSLFQETVLRVRAIDGALAPVIVVGAAHLGAARAQLAAIDVKATLLVEPQGRDSGPALIAAALWIARTDPAAIALAVSSDHHIPDAVAFAASVKSAAMAAQRGEIVTFGVAPHHPATAFGYIEPGAATQGAAGVRRVIRFIEKPDAVRAAAFVGAGYLWNSGNFVFRVDALLGQAALHAPRMLDAVQASIVSCVNRDGVVEIGARFLEAPKLSIDVAVMEKTAAAAVLAIDYAWSDLGSWRAVWAASAKDAAGNAVSAQAAAPMSENCLIRADDGVQVLAVGLKNIAVIVHNGQVLVCDLDASADLKVAIAALPGPSPAANEGIAQTEPQR